MMRPIAIALVATACLVACGNDATTTAAPAATTTTTAPAATTTTITTTSTTTSTTVPERLTDRSRLRLDGIGPVSVGMTVAEASTAARTTLRIVDPGVYGTDCDYAHADGTAAGLDFMVIHDVVVRVDVRGSSPVSTVSGAHIGSTEAEVNAAYPGRITVTGHPYLSAGHYLVYTPADPGQRAYSLIFETDGQRVTSFRAGYTKDVSAIEGCA